MVQTIPDNRKQRGRPRVGSTLIGLRLEPELLQAVDAARRSEDVTRPEAVRRALTDWLRTKGFLEKGDENER